MSREYNLYDVTPGTLAGLGLGSTQKGEKITAWNLELGYTFNLAGKETVVAAALQGTEDAEGLLPETRYGGAVSVGLFEHITVALEYIHDEYENDDSGDLVTAQLALEILTTFSFNCPYP